MSHFSFTPHTLKNYAQYAWFKGVFSEEECEKIISLGGALERSKTGGKLSDEMALITGTDDVEPDKIRSSDHTWINWNNEVDWVFQKLALIAGHCNSKRYGFQLSGFFEPLQFTRYEKGDYYGSHQDLGPGECSKRKLSLVVQLSSPEKYKGGSLVFGGFEKDEVPADQGTVILFPSYNPHQVLEVTEGTRYSLVGWISGEPFR